MSASLTISIPLVPAGESSPRAMIFKIELTRGKALSPMFSKADIILELVYGHTDVEPMVVQKLDEKATLLVFPVSEEKKCNTMQSIEMW